MTLVIQEMVIADYEEAVALWKGMEGIGLSSADDRQKVERFLTHNTGLSFVCRLDGKLVGTILCGEDGRRGYLYHMAVASQHRRRGIGRRLVERSLAALKGRGIERCHLVVYAENVSAVSFWGEIGWRQRHELVMMSKDL